MKPEDALMNSLNKIDVVRSELIERGQSIYEQSLKQHLEPAQVGRFVAIEPASGSYFLGDTATAALVAARAAMPNSLFYLTRVGQQTAHTVGGHASRIR